MILKILKAFHIALLAFSLLCYIAPQVPPDHYRIAGFMGYLIVPLITVNALLMLVWLLIRPSMAWLPGLALITGLFFYADESIALHYNEVPDKTGVEIMSYNVRVFNRYDHLHNSPDECRKFVSWVKQHPADVKCLQEFYHLNGSSVFNSIEQLKNEGEYNCFFASAHKVDGQRFGMAIFSRFPIVHKGLVVSYEGSNNQVIFADLALPGRDTLRVINMHLASMSIEADSMFSLEEGGIIDGIPARLSRGWKIRTAEIRKLLNFIDQTPYPVVLCGDLNDLPYSYAYQQLAYRLNNAFEEAGYGTGFTFNGKLFFLRIDNQFFSEQLSALSFKTLRKISFSDHYPLVGIYQLNR